MRVGPRRMAIQARAGVFVVAGREVVGGRRK